MHFPPVPLRSLGDSSLWGKRHFEIVPGCLWHSMGYDFLGFACASCVLLSYLFEAAGCITGSVGPGGVGYMSGSRNP